MMNLGAVNSPNFGALKINRNAASYLNDLTLEQQRKIREEGNDMKDRQYSDMIIEEKSPLAGLNYTVKDKTGITDGNNEICLIHDNASTDGNKLIINYYDGQINTRKSAYTMRNSDQATSFANEMNSADRYGRALLMVDALEVAGQVKTEHEEAERKAEEERQKVMQEQRDGANALMDDFAFDDENDSV